jgi:ABC-type phosphate transport system substrate-binding protein
VARACAGGLALAALAPGGVAGADPAVPFSNDVPDYVYGTGSDTTYALMVALGDAYNESQGCNQAFPDGAACLPAPQSGVVKTENYDHDVVVNRAPIGSANGRIGLCEQTTPRPAGVPYVGFARSSAGPSTDGCVDSGLVLRFVAFARDAVAPVNWRSTTGSPADGVGSLTQAQLNHIYVDCTITDWSQVGGSNAPIEVWGLFPGSGTRSSWDGFVGGNSLACVANLAHIVHPTTSGPSRPWAASPTPSCPSPSGRTSPIPPEPARPSLWR